ncbi:MAG: hypothetical protein ACRDU4_01205 [Mycobacterium sp.]
MVAAYVFLGLAVLCWVPMILITLAVHPPLWAVLVMSLPGYACCAAGQWCVQKSRRAR